MEEIKQKLLHIKKEIGEKEDIKFVEIQKQLEESDDEDEAKLPPSK